MMLYLHVTAKHHGTNFFSCECLVLEALIIHVKQDHLPVLRGFRTAVRATQERQFARNATNSAFLS